MTNEYAIYRLPNNRPCFVINTETGEQQRAMFHLWTVSLDGWPRALVEFEDGHMASVGYRKIIFCDNEDFGTLASWTMYEMVHGKRGNNGTTE